MPRMTFLAAAAAVLISGLARAGAAEPAARVVFENDFARQDVGRLVEDPPNSYMIRHGVMVGARPGTTHGAHP